MNSTPALSKLRLAQVFGLMNRAPVSNISALILAVALLVVPRPAVAQKVSFYPYDFTEPTSKRVPFGQEGIEIRRASQRVAQDYVCGAYKGPFDMTGGNTLHIFPDGTAMITEWCDICPTRLVSEGKWTLQDGRLKLRWARWKFQNQRFEESFRKMYGKCTDLGVYLEFQGKDEKHVLLVPAESEATASLERFFVQSARYADWPRIRDDLRTTDR